MLDGNRCELCRDVIEGKRAEHNQTKYCHRCAKRRKRENSLDPLHPDERREYMRRYMRKYRKSHPHLSTRYVRAHRQKKTSLQKRPEEPLRKNQGPPAAQAILYCGSILLVVVFCALILSESAAIGLATITFERIQGFIGRCAVTIVELTGLIVVSIFCSRHVKDLFRK